MQKKPIQSGRKFADVWFMDAEVTSNLVQFYFLKINLNKWKNFQPSEDYQSIYEVLTDERETVWKKFIIYIGETRTIDESDELINFILEKKKLLVGYNNNHYDNCILNRILELDWALLPTPEERIEQLFKLSTLIIEKNRESWPTFVLTDWYYWHRERPYFTLDLLEILTVNQNRPSAKHCGIVLKFPKLQDLPFEPGEAIPESALEMVDEYNKHDVRINAGVYLAILPDIEFREKESRFWNLDLFSASDTKIAKVILDAKINFPPDASDHVNRIAATPIAGKTLIPSRIEFHNEPFLSLVDDLQNNLLDSSGYVLKAYGIKPMKKMKDSKTGLDKWVYDRQRYKKHFSFNGIDFIFGVGGMHSADEPGIFKTTDDEEIIDADVTSYYPFIFINEELVPEFLDKDDFLRGFEGIVFKRTDAKHLAKTAETEEERDAAKLEAQRLKIAANSTFGLTKSVWWKLYDPKVFFGITIAGQLYLLDLIEKLAEGGIQTISANTDGIVCRVPKALKESYDEICREWQERTRFELEFNVYKKYIRLNVNSYLTIKKDGSVKRKKDFESNLPGNCSDLDWKRVFGRGFAAPVISLALNAYFLEGVPPERFIGNHNDIYDFCFTQRMGSQFKPVWRTEEKFTFEVIEKGSYFEKLIQDYYSRTPKLGNPTAAAKKAREELIEGGWLEWEETELQKTNRYFVANEQGRYLIKIRKSNGAETRVFADQKVQLLNDLQDPRAIDPWLDQYDLNYDWYIAEVQKRIDEIENPPAKKKSATKRKYLQIGYKPENPSSDKGDPLKSSPETDFPKQKKRLVISARNETPGIEIWEETIPFTERDFRNVQQILKNRMDGNEKNR